jgi:hypothetical protein
MLPATPNLLPTLQSPITKESFDTLFLLNNFRQIDSLVLENYLESLH